MTDDQQNQIDAAQVTYDYLQEAANAPIWTPLQAFADDVTGVEGSLNILDALAQIQAGKTTGITANKERLRQSVGTRLVRVAKAAISLGNATGNGDLVAQAEALNSISEVKAIKSGELANRATDLLNRATAARDADSATAAKYGFKTGADDKLLAPLQSAIAAYSPVAQGPQGAVNARANATTGIGHEITHLLGLLRDMDNLVAQFEEDQPDFVAGYHRARQIINRGASGKAGNGTTPAPPPAP